MLNTFTLKNGLKVVTYSIPSMKSAHLSIAAKAGYIFDKPENSGLAHFMEHILCEGTPTYPNIEVFTDAIEQMAGNFNAGTSVQKIRFYLNTPSQNIKEMLKIASEVWFEPLFPEDSIERERNAIKEEIKGRQDTGWYKNARFFAKTRYRKNHPLLLDGGGEEESINRLQREDLVNYWTNFFHPKNTYLTITGGIDNKEVKKLVEDAFEKYTSKKTFPGFPKLTNLDFSNRTVAIRQDPELKTCTLDINIPSISDQSPLSDRIPQSLIRSILGGLRRSRLYRLLRQRKGLVYSVSCGSATFSTFGYFNISSQCVEENLAEVLRLITIETKSFLENGPTEEEIDFARNYSVNSALMAFDHPENIAGWIEDDLIWEDKIYMPEEYVKLYKSVNIKDIKDFMKKYWDFAKLNLVIQGPIKNSRQNISKFSQIIKDIK